MIAFLCMLAAGCAIAVIMARWPGHAFAASLAAMPVFAWVRWSAGDTSGAVVPLVVAAFYGLLAMWAIRQTPRSPRTS